MKANEIKGIADGNIDAYLDHFRGAGHEFWARRTNRVAYMEWLGGMLGFSDPDHWYNLTCSDVALYGGQGLLSYHRNSVHSIVKDFMPKREWNEWMFSWVSADFWGNKKNVTRYLKWLGELLGFKSEDDWYSLRHHQIIANYGSGLCKRYESSVQKILIDGFPGVKWKEWLFCKISKGFWDSADNQRRYLEWLGNELGYGDIRKHHEKWYAIDKSDIMANHGLTLLKIFGSASALVTGVFPEIEWKEWMFRNPPDGFWNVKDNRMRYLGWLGDQLNIKEMDDWYNVTGAILRNNHGRGMIEIFGSSIIGIFREHYPGHDWKEWLFGIPRPEYWRVIGNRREYLEWLGNKLGFKKPSDWRGLTTKHVYENNGKGILRLYRGSIEDMLANSMPRKKWLR